MCVGNNKMKYIIVCIGREQVLILTKNISYTNILFTIMHVNFLRPHNLFFKTFANAVLDTNYYQLELFTGTLQHF